MAERNAPTESTGDKVDGQHWTTVRELCMKKDKEQCESWKDEVQNVLIFSGLFSAIVTAFVIESHKALRPEESVQLLRQIAVQSAGKTWVAGAEPGVDSTSICVNVFWFLSLVLSLTAALVGIVSLQWIRTHLSSLSDGSESLGFSHMHSLGLHQSYIPLVFTSLPIILIFGLIFFLIGLVVFLFELSWPVTIPVAVAIVCTFVFLLTTTAHPGLQRVPVSRPSDKPDYYPSPYRSPQSLLFFQLVTLLKQWWRGAQARDNSHLRGQWTWRSRIWLQRRKEDFSVKERVLSHLEPNQHGAEVEPFAYDIVQALVSVKESRSAESEKERTALAKCLAEVLPIHLDLFPTGDLADLIPFLPPSDFIPSGVFLHDASASREVLSAVALLQIATCKGRPTQSAVLFDASVRTTRWLFERPRTLVTVSKHQPLHLISKPEKLSPGGLEVLLDSLTRFFSSATEFHPESRTLHKTTFTSPYTYWYLVLSAKILTKCSLSDEMQARHSIILRIIAIRLNKGEADDYLFHTASIYASNISSSPVMRSSPFWRDFLRAVHSRRSDFLQGDASQLRQALKANEVIWGNIDHALEDLGNPNANGTMVAHCPLFCSSEQGPTLGDQKEVADPSSSFVHNESSHGHEGKLEVIIGRPLSV